MTNHDLKFNGKNPPPSKTDWQNETRLRLALEATQAFQITRMCEKVGLSVVAQKYIRTTGYRERSLKMYPWVCGRCMREFNHCNDSQLTVHPFNDRHIKTMTTIRLAQQADAKNLAALAIQVWLHTYALNGISTLLSDYVFAEFTEEKFQQLIAAPDKCILVAEVDAHLVGYARLNFNAARSDVSHTSTELATLYVQEHFTRRQIGTALLAACAQQARRRCGNPAFWLTVNHRNTRAITFYKKAGYTRHGTFFFEIGDERHENFVLA